MKFGGKRKREKGFWYYDRGGGERNENPRGQIMEVFFLFFQNPSPRKEEKSLLVYDKLGWSDGQKDSFFRVFACHTYNLSLAHHLVYL